MSAPPAMARGASQGAPRAVVIAIDGPAASGKGTIGRRVAERFGFAYLDTGLLYRAVAAKLLAAGGAPAEAAAAEDVARAVSAADLARDDLRAAATGAASSIVAAHPGVRAALLAFQRGFAATPPGARLGAVLDGRDIGTVICPAADVKLFVTAASEERARRRAAELDLPIEGVLEDIRARDRRDSERAAAPLRRADDAILLDTTDLGIDAAVAAAISHVESCLRRRGAHGDG